MSITDFLYKYRLSLSSFAETCGVSRETIRRAKLGENITLRTALLIARASKGKISLSDLKVGDL